MVDTLQGCDDISSRSDLMLQVMEIFRLSESEFDKAVESFIRERISLMCQSQKPQVIDTYDGQGVYSQFIHPESDVKVFFNHPRSLRIDDDAIYKVFFGFLRRDPNLFRAIQETLKCYFGDYIQDDEISQCRARYYRREGPDLFVSVSALKGKAVCVEKAAVAHNILHFLGLESHFICSDRCFLDNAEIMHAYLVIAYEGRLYIYDPTNPNEERTGVANLVIQSPFLHEINRSIFQNLLADGYVESRYTACINERTVVRKVRYAGPVFSWEEHFRRCLIRSFMSSSHKQDRGE